MMFYFHLVTCLWLDWSLQVDHMLWFTCMWWFSWFSCMWCLIWFMSSHSVVSVKSFSYRCTSSWLTEFFYNLIIFIFDLYLPWLQYFECISFQCWVYFSLFSLHFSRFSLFQLCTFVFHFFTSTSRDSVIPLHFLSCHVISYTCLRVVFHLLPFYHITNFL